MWKEKYTIILLSALIIAILVFMWYYIQHEYGNTHGDMSYDDYVQYSFWFIPM